MRTELAQAPDLATPGESRMDLVWSEQLVEGVEEVMAALTGNQSNLTFPLNEII